MTQTKIFLHIGPPKTGSTSIQRVLDQSYLKLLEHGILYPQGGRLQEGESYWVNRSVGRSLVEGPMDSHQLLAWAMMGEVEEFDLSTCWSTILSELEQVKAHSMVISGESFSRLPEDKIANLQTLLSDFQVKIIIYLRDPFKRLLSLYTQEVKMGRYFKPFSHFIRDQEEQIYLNETLFKRWNNYFDASNLVVRQFENILKESSFEDDFFKILGLDLSKVRPSIKTDLNQSPSPSVVRMLTAANWIEHRLGIQQYFQYPFRVIRNRIRKNSIEWKLLIAVTNKLFPGPLFTEEDRSYVHLLTEKIYNNLLS